jgi:hypothetical protein
MTPEPVRTYGLAERCKRSSGGYPQMMDADLGRLASCRDATAHATQRARHDHIVCQLSGLHCQLSRPAQRGAPLHRLIRSLSRCTSTKRPSEAASRSAAQPSNILMLLQHRICPLGRYEPPAAGCCAAAASRLRLLRLQTCILLCLCRPTRWPVLPSTPVLTAQGQCCVKCVAKSPPGNGQVRAS